MSEEFLDVPNIRAILKQMCRKRVAQRMKCSTLGDTSAPLRVFKMRSANQKAKTDLHLLTQALAVGFIFGHAAS